MFFFFSFYDVYLENLSFVPFVTNKYYPFKPDLLLVLQFYFLSHINHINDHDDRDVLQVVLK